MSTPITLTDPPPTRATIIRAALGRAQDALGDALDLPAHDPQARFDGINALTLALAGLDEYPGPRDADIDHRAAHELNCLRGFLKDLAERVQDLATNLRTNRLELAGRYIDPLFPTLAARDFARGLFVHSLPTGMSAVAVR